MLRINCRCMLQYNLPLQPLESLSNASEIKNLWPNRDLNPDLQLEKFLSSPHCRDHLFNDKDSWQKYTNEKMKNDPIGMITFTHLNMWQKLKRCLTSHVISFAPKNIVEVKFGFEP